MLTDRLQHTCKFLGTDKSALSGVDILFLPENIESAATVDELFDTNYSIELAKHAKAHGAKCKTAFDLGIQPEVKERRAGEFWLGVVWILSNVGLPVLLDLLGDVLKGKLGIDGKEPASTIHIELMLQRGDQVASLKFDGPATDFLKVTAALKDSQIHIDQ